MNAIINMEKSPNDKILKGNEIIDKTGFKILNPIASKSPPIKKVLKSP
jgi:hypothetical protein